MFSFLFAGWCCTSSRHFLLEKSLTKTPTPLLVDISSLKKLPDSIQFCQLFPGKCYFSITNCKKVYVKLGKNKKMLTATTDVGVIKIFTVALQVPLTFFHKYAFSSTGFCIFRKLGWYHQNFVFFKNIKLIG